MDTYKVISSSSPEDLTMKVNSHIQDGWKPVGSHQVVTTIKQNQFSGSQETRSIYSHEYTQTMIKE